MTAPNPDEIERLRDPVIMTGARPDDGLFEPDPPKPAWWRRALVAVLEWSPVARIVNRVGRNAK